MDLSFRGTKLWRFSVFRVFIFADASSLTVAILRTMMSLRSKMDVLGNSLALLKLYNYSLNFRGTKLSQMAANPRKTAKD